MVELRIFDVTDAREQRDITFTYNANFFIFTSLRLARPIAHGRVQSPAATSPPVLTGVPCSGIAYLDRPSEAGYFLFPDLSVRHEGRYKLAFTLYEETKEPADFDVEDGDPPETQHFAFRMEIESEPFTVYSAKKFPGLTESTSLSRNLSDQGVRVRIRRDVRMRRRDGKGGGGGGEAQKAEGEYARRQARTPERQQPIDPYRQRSLSATSEHGRLPYDLARRPSGPEYPVAPAPPPPRSYSSASAGNLNFGPQAQYPTRTPIANPQPSPTTPTFSSSHSSPMQTQALPRAPLTIKTETRHSHQPSPQPSPRTGHRQSMSNTSLPGISSLLAETRAETMAQTRMAPFAPPKAPVAPVSRFLRHDEIIEVDQDTQDPVQLLRKPGAGEKRGRDQMSSGGPYEGYRCDEDGRRAARRPGPPLDSAPVSAPGVTLQIGERGYPSGPYSLNTPPPYITNLYAGTT